MSSDIAPTDVSGKFLYRYGDTTEWRSCSAYEARQKIANTQDDYKHFPNGINRQSLSVIVDLFNPEAASDLKSRFATQGRAQKRHDEEFCAMLETFYGDDTRRSAASSETRTYKHSASLCGMKPLEDRMILGLRLSPLDGRPSEDIVPLLNLQETTETKSPLIMHWGTRTNATGAEIPQVTQPLEDSDRVRQLIDTISRVWWNTEDSIVLRRGCFTERLDDEPLDVSLNSASWRSEKSPTTDDHAGGPLFEVEGFVRYTGKGLPRQLKSEVGVWTGKDIEDWTNDVLDGSNRSRYLALRIRKL